MPAKRRLDNFDPNKSDSDDTDFDPTEVRASAKKPPRSSKKASRSTKKRAKRSGYGGSDVSDDDESGDSLEDDSFLEDEEEEEPVEMSSTGRAIRSAAKKTVNYEESEVDDADDIAGDLDDESDEPQKRPQSKRLRKALSDEDDSMDEEPIAKRPRPSKVVKLKLRTPQPPITSRATRASSAARGLRNGSTEPTSAGLPRRSTRAHTEEGDEPIALSVSGNHIVRADGGQEPIATLRGPRGAKGLKQPAATIKEEINETSSYDPEAGDAGMATEIAGTDDQDDQDDAQAATQELNEATNNHSNDSGADADTALASVMPEMEDDDEDEDVMPVSKGRTRGSRAGLPSVEDEEPVETTGGLRRLTRGSKPKARKHGAGASSDNEFEPPNEASEDELSASDHSPSKKDNDDEYASSAGGRGRRGNRVKSKSSSRRRGSPDSEEILDEDELAEELQELQKDKGRKRRSVRDETAIEYIRPEGRARKKVDYSIKPMDQIYAADEDDDDDAPTASTPNRRARGGRNGGKDVYERLLHSTFGPFGGGGGPQPAIGGPWGTGAIGGVDSDSSDDETMLRPSGVSGNIGMTPTSAMPPSLLPGLGQINNPDAAAAMQGTPANLGKVKSQKALADADPLGVDQNVDFTKIGGLEGHIDQLKEMVQMPLLYPELFLKFHVTPPRGVLFHGPPGTGKTLLARALAASVGSGGRKITFYMRKGADALSKWVGEAERQLRLLFEEARKTQPSIIFFDEIDGLAPVRSSKQEQIHASIVSTLLALMDGMDGRGQVIVIGATNRPDNIDPALRRPGRFDREFYFPLPDLAGRKSILNIHTRDWGIDDAFKTSLAHITKGYGGADLRALCTEAALNAIQRTYPQIYSSNDKLKVDESKIKITAKDFMLSVKKMIPSSERSTSSGAAPLPKIVEPLLREQLKKIEEILDGLIPIKKKTTALQEAMFEQYDDDDHGFGRETLQQEFEKSRVFRPRLLIGGEPGMGQSYLGGAILNHFEGLHVQSFDLPTIYSDSARVSFETMIVCVGYADIY
jgi:SpoVK/Ycf46/Vps4 family AAA+-type ATPase